MKIVVSAREAATYIFFRKLGYSINQIAKAFGRSTSVVHRRIKFAEFLFSIRKIDLRKLPSHIKRLSASIRWQKLMRKLPLWERWILGEGEEPP